MMYKMLIICIVVALLVASPVQLLAQESDGDAQTKIESAMSAGPTLISQDATILDWTLDADGKFVVLREGMNGWSCLPDNPGAAHAVCLDRMFMEWLYAWVAGKELNVTVPGFAYLLQGSEVLSNSNPWATEPAEDYWVTSSPYMMVLLPASVDLSAITTDPDAPLFVMFADTPLQHLMVPIGDVEDTGP
jgi:hypothetical protein